ncbi:MAG: MBOAT family protein [Bacteroidaceae bacterium]|nr:MBOAT family protein [Bacteroidaceae bacterium]
MSFTSLSFLVFLPIVFALYWALRHHLRWQNALIVLASYVFYGWWDWRFLLLIALTTTASYACGLVIERCEGRESWRRALSAANICLNLGILGLFKYFDFFSENFAALLRTFGLHADALTLHLILPVGISFYTFQALSYTIDVYCRRLPATRDVLAFFAYISFFPQLVAGPIERATHLLPQMLHARTFNYPAAVDGLRQMLWGFCKKMLVADSCALAVDIIWQSPAEQSALALVVGAFLFAIQIYGDFSGYSDIAVGCARLFGISLMQNFRTPYFASSITDFWRRWHISLMTWLRDYVYIPLGGNRCSRARQLRNTFTVFLLSGLWHGAAWTFILWGLYHAVLVCLEKTRRSILHFPFSILHFPSSFLLVTIGWIIFRAPDLSALGAYLAGLTHLSTLTAVSSLTMGKQALLWSAALLLIEWLQRHRSHALDFPARGLLRHRSLRWAIYYALLALLLFCHAEQHTFIYFQF